MLEIPRNSMSNTSPPPFISLPITNEKRPKVTFRHQNPIQDFLNTKLFNHIGEINPISPLKSIRKETGFFYIRKYRKLFLFKYDH